jgi:hypothetical protein
MPCSARSGSPCTGGCSRDTRRYAYNVLHIVFIPHLQVIIPATWMVEDLAWEFLADRVGHAVVTMVAHGLETKDRFDAALTEVTVGLSCSALSYRQLDGVEGIHTAPVKQEPANEADEVEDEEEEETSEAEHESDPESYKSDDTEEYLPLPRVQGPGSRVQVLHVLTG